MTYHGRREREYEQPNGIRRIEIRFSGDIDASGKLKLKRCVGKSFLDKSRKISGLPAGVNPAQSPSKKAVQPVLAARTDKSA